MPLKDRYDIDIESKSQHKISNNKNASGCSKYPNQTNSKVPPEKSLQPRRDTSITYDNIAP